MRKGSPKFKSLKSRSKTNRDSQAKRKETKAKGFFGFCLQSVFKILPFL